MKEAGSDQRAGSIEALNINLLATATYSLGILVYIYECHHFLHPVTQPRSSYTTPNSPVKQTSTFTMWKLLISIILSACTNAAVLTSDAPATTPRALLPRGDSVFGYYSNGKTGSETICKHLYHLAAPPS